MDIGGDPEQAIGYIDDSVSPKVKTYLLAAKSIVLNEQTAGILKQMLSQSQDAAQAVAVLVAKTIDGLETKLGPLTDEEHDQVAVYISGWLVSSLQRLGMPGLDQQDGRHDLLGRILQNVDKMTQGDPQQDAPAGPPDASQGQPPPPGPPQGGPPLAQLQGA